MNGQWHYVRGTLVTRPVPAWGPNETQDYSVIVYCVDGWIVAALDRREDPDPEWEAVVEWGDGLTVPVCSTWRSACFGCFISPLAQPRP